MVDIDENYFKDTPSNSPNSYLQEDEKVIWRGTPKKSAYVAGKTIGLTPFALIWGFIDFVILFLIFSSGESLSMLIFVIPFFAIHLTPFWMWLASLIKTAKEQKTIEYVITNLRILELRGKQKYIANYLYIDNLTDAKLRIGFIDKILGVGDITLSAGDKFLMLCDIKNPVNFHAKLLALCNTHDPEKESFDNKTFVCSNCGTEFSASEERCPSCGSPYHK